MKYLKHAMLPAIFLGMGLIIAAISACEQTKTISVNVDQTKAAAISAAFR